MRRRANKEKESLLIAQVQALLGDTRDLSKGVPSYSLLQDTVETLCNFLDARAGTEDFFSAEFAGPRSAVEALHFAVVAEQARDAMLDMRAVSNPGRVANALIMYLNEAQDSVFPLTPYLRISEFFPRIEDAKATELLQEVQKIIDGLSTHNFGILQRLVILMQNFPLARTALRDAVFKPPEMAGGREIAVDQKERFLTILLREAKRFFPKPYVNKCSASQNRGFELLALTEADMQTIFRNKRVTNFKQGEVILQENSHNSSIFRIMLGKVVVFAGRHKVGTLGVHDMMGEVSVLGSTQFTRAKTVAQSPTVTVWEITSTDLDSVFSVRPDLGARFWALISLQVAKRVNVQVGSSANLTARDSAGEDAQGGAAAAAAVASSSSSSSKDANAPHSGALLAFRSPDKHLRCLFVFQSSLLLNKVRWGRSKNVEVDFACIEDIKLVGDKELEFIYVLSTDKGKESFVFRFEMADARDQCVEACKRLQQDIKAKKTPGGVVFKTPAPQSSKNVAQALALFPYKPRNQFEVEFAAGDRIVIMELNAERENWCFGFNSRNPLLRGLIPLHYIEMLPVGCMISGMPTEDDWQFLFHICESRVASRGEVILKQEDAMSVGNLLIFLGEGADAVVLDEKGAVSKKLGFVAPNTMVGEISFLLGGPPRVSIIFPLVSQQPTLKYLLLRRERIESALRDPNQAAFACRFFKFMAVNVCRRLTVNQFALSQNLNDADAFTSVQRMDMFLAGRTK